MLQSDKKDKIRKSREVKSIFSSLRALPNPQQHREQSGGKRFLNPLHFFVFQVHLVHVTGGITLAGTTIIQPLGNSLLHVKVVSSFEGHLVRKTNMIF